MDATFCLCHIGACEELKGEYVEYSKQRISFNILDCVYERILLDSV